MISRSEAWAGFDRFQAHFHQRWRHLQQPDVRALAWLLDSPDLFDPELSNWGPHLARLALPDHLDDWLQQLEQNPAPLQAGLQPSMRLGRYAEKLMGFFLQQHAGLVAQGLQVRAGKNETVGEFDFLLRAAQPDVLAAAETSHAAPPLWHWEFATKFYLYDAKLNSSGKPDGDGYFIGPNLADSLGAKMQKIVHRQLALAQHPAAQALLPGQVVAAQALVKGWLFYYQQQAAASIGLSPDHCRGFWCTVAQLEALPETHFALLRRLRWLAPARVEPAMALSKAALIESLNHYFLSDTMPVMLACLRPDPQTEADAMTNIKANINANIDAPPGATPQHSVLLEARRGFVVPNDWRERAAQSPHAPQSDLRPQMQRDNGLQ
jgi:hypothetical protein